MDESYLDKLNGQQRDAVVYCDGPQLVIAGAGSGKTRVLTYKIVHLLAHGYEPWRILALTFTNKAAREMRERIEKLTGHETASKLWMGTFHSIFARILRRNADLIGFKSSFTIYDASDSKSLVKTIIKDMQLDDKVYKASSVLSAISWAKNALVSPEAYAADAELMAADRQSRRPLIADIYHAYRDRCLVAGAMDFDDLLYYTNILLIEHPEVARHYREFFRYILVDEYQDTNQAQHRIVTLLTGESQNLCVVGDDAQSIYSFRGANIRNILDLERSFPRLETFKLERNYRSTRNIIDAAGSLIDKNTEQIRKNVFSENDRGARIEVVRCYSDFEEAYQVAARVSQRKLTTGDSFDEFAILYRTNAQSRVLEEALRKRNIPYRIYGGLSFYQRKEVKDAVCYMRLAVNPDDDEALRRVINTPARGIGETTLAKLTRAAVENNTSIWQVLHHPDIFKLKINSGTRNKLTAFHDLIQKFMMLGRRDDAYTVARRIIEDTGLFSMYLHDNTPENISKRENIQELLNGVKEFVENSTEQGSEELGLTTFLSEISLATDQDSDGDSTGDHVTLMTAHAAKGLEFNNVFIVGVEEELFPSAMVANNFRGVEEERRLLYVAITRARHFCMMSYAVSRFRNGQPSTPRPSRFIGDIDPAYLHLDTGTDFQNENQTAPPSRQVRFTPSMAGSARPLSDLRRPVTRPAASPSAAGDFGKHTPSEVSEGTKIEHAKFGRGVIESIDVAGTDPRMIVRFESDEMETRTLLFKFAKFNILSNL